MQRLSILATMALLFVIAAVLNFNHFMAIDLENRVSKFII